MDCIEGNTVLHQLMTVRMKNVINGITGAKLLIDQYASEHIASRSHYGEPACQLGFSDYAELLLVNPHLSFKK